MQSLSDNFIRNFTNIISAITINKVRRLYCYGTLGSLDIQIQTLDVRVKLGRGEEVTSFIGIYWW